MNTLLNRLPLYLVLGVAAFAAVALTAACGGGDDDDAGSVGGICKALEQDSYTYKVDVTQEVREIEGTPVPGAPPGPNAFQFSEKLQGKIEDGRELEAEITNGDPYSSLTFNAIQLEGGRGFLRFPEEGWHEQDTSVRPLPVRYWPDTVCAAFSPDFAIGAASAEGSEEVNGIASKKYHVEVLSSGFFARSPDFGSGSDAAAVVDRTDATVWIADRGGYLSKLDVTGTGTYPDGHGLEFHVVMEITGMDDSITVRAP